MTGDAKPDPSATPAPTWKIEVAPAAVRQLGKLDGSVRRRVVAAIDGLAATPRPAGVKALTGHPGLLRVRVGDYRVVYTVRDEHLVVLVVAVAHRREVYRGI